MSSGFVWQHGLKDTPEQSIPTVYCKAVAGHVALVVFAFTKFMTAKLLAATEPNEEFVPL